MNHKTGKTRKERGLAILLKVYKARE